MSGLGNQPLPELPPVATTRPHATGVAALNAGAIVVAGLYLGRELLVPMVLAVLLAFMLAPLVLLLQRLRLGRGPSVLIVVMAAFVVIGAIGTVVAGQASSLARSLPSYHDTIQDKVRSLAAGSEALGHLAERLRDTVGAGGGADPAAARPPSSTVPADLDPSSALSLARSVVLPLFSPLATAGVVAVFAIFVLMAREDLRDRLVRLLGRKDLQRTILALNDTARRLSRYFLFQLLLNSGFGVFVATGLWFVGLPGAALWGILAGTMRFVPFIGTVIAVVPPVLLALAVAPGWSLALIVLGLFILTDVVVSQVLEPLLFSHSTGLSPIAIIVAAAFWAFLWGPVGLLLATPLTVCLVVLGRYIEPLAFLEVMLGDTPPLEPAETFYQRALEGNTREMTLAAERAIASTSLQDYYDRVAMLGLALIQTDLARDALAFERLDDIHTNLETLLGTLSRRPAAEPAEGAAVPPRWTQDGAILCIPGRGQLDGLATAMAVQVLQRSGFGVRQVSNTVLGAGRDKSSPFESAALCCLSVLDKGSTAAGIRYLLRRIQRQAPGLPVVVCLWQAEATSPLLQALRAEGEEETIVLSLGELVALARVVAARSTQRVAATAD